MTTSNSEIKYFYVTCGEKMPYLESPAQQGLGDDVEQKNLLRVFKTLKHVRNYHQAFSRFERNLRIACASKKEIEEIVNRTSKISIGGVKYPLSVIVCKNSHNEWPEELEVFE